MGYKIKDELTFTNKLCVKIEENYFCSYSVALLFGDSETGKLGVSIVKNNNNTNNNIKQAFYTQHLKPIYVIGMRKLER